MNYETPEEYYYDLQKEPKQGNITRYFANDGGDVIFFAQGPDATVPGITFRCANGDEINIVLGGSLPIINLFQALASAVNGQAKRLIALSELVHDEVGCKRSHELMRSSLAGMGEVNDPPEEPLPDGVTRFPGSKKHH